MRVGIISMQRIHNYGSFLQAYALKQILEKMGNEVEFVDYRVEKTIVEKEVKRKFNFFQKAYSFLKHRSTSTKRAMYKLAKQYNENIESYFNLLGITEKMNNGNNVDAFIIGSDEVFNCLQDNPEVGFSRDLFGRNSGGKKCITYAASFGSTTLSGLKKYKIDNEIAEMLKKINTISVRDENSKCIVNSLTNKVPELNVDPVLLYDFSTEMASFKNKMSDYIAVYSYRGRFTEQEGKAIKKYAKETGRKIIGLGGVLDFCDEYVQCSPFEIMHYVKNADCVITDTFHGTIFSIKFKKNFATIIRESNKEKLGYLLEQFQLQSRACSNLNELSTILKTSYDVNTVQKCIAQEQQKAQEYLERNLYS